MAADRLIRVRLYSYSNIALHLMFALMFQGADMRLQIKAIVKITILMTQSRSTKETIERTR